VSDKRCDNQPRHSDGCGKRVSDDCTGEREVAGVQCHFLFLVFRPCISRSDVSSVGYGRSRQSGLNVDWLLSRREKIIKQLSMGPYCAIHRSLSPYRLCLFSFLIQRW